MSTNPGHAGDPSAATPYATPNGTMNPSGASTANGTPGSAIEGQPIHMRLFGRTDVGRIREHNEDNFLVADLSQHARGLMENIRSHDVGSHGTLLAVCDGMGGAAAGEVASKLAVDIIYEQMQSGGAPKHREELARRLVRAVENAGMRIFAEAKADRNRRGMGTTATAAALVDDYLFLAQVGDSRGYLLRDGKLELVTRDQSLVNQLIEAGQLTEEEAENFEHSNIILQALGTADTVQVDLTYVRIRQGDTLLLCSDGLSGMVRAEEMRQALIANPEPIDVCKVLTDKANEAGGHDNITVIVAKFDGAPPLTAEDEPAKYKKYVFTTTEEAEPALPATISATPSAMPAAGSDSVHPGANSPQVRAGLKGTQVGLDSRELQEQMRLLEQQRATPTSMPPRSLPPPPQENPADRHRAEMESAGIPSGAVSPWIWVATLLALGLIAAGMYVFLGGKGLP